MASNQRVMASKLRVMASNLASTLRSSDGLQPGRVRVWKNFSPPLRPLARPPLHCCLKSSPCQCLDTEISPCGSHDTLLPPRLKMKHHVMVFHQFPWPVASKRNIKFAASSHTTSNRPTGSGSPPSATRVKEICLIKNKCCRATTFQSLKCFQSLK